MLVYMYIDLCWYRWYNMLVLPTRTSYIYVGTGGNVRDLHYKSICRSRMNHRTKPSMRPECSKFRTRVTRLSN